jgi:uncharacterized membrane protein YdbT with pleckstrin-like domain
MSSYIQETLLVEEKLLYWVRRPHWVVFLFPFVLILISLNLPAIPPLTSILSLAILLFGIFKAAQSVIYYYTSEYGVTNKRVLLKIGWIRRSSLEIYLHRVESVHIAQSILGRFLNYGSIRVVGMGGSSDLFAYVPEPIRFRKEVQKAVNFQKTQN